MTADSHDAVRAAAERYGIELPDEAFEGFVTAFEASADALGTLDSSDPVDESATDVEAGTDPHNAIRCRFRLESVDGPLSDLRLGVKDNVAVAGVPLTGGSAALSYTPSFHATVVRRLRDAGADVQTTTNMDEFAFFSTGETCAHGPIENPRTPEAVAGGSSSGSAAAVAAGNLDAALGTDTAGSVRIPASYCGVVGLKPTRGAVSRFGTVALAPSLDHVGVLAASTGSAERVFERLTGPDPRDQSTYARGAESRPTVAVDDCHIGVVEEAMDDADDGVRSQVDAAVETLVSAGVTATRVSLPAFGAASLASLATVTTEFASYLADGVLYGAGGGYSDGMRAALSDVAIDELGENVFGRVLVGASLAERGGGHHYVAAERVRETLTAAVDDHLTDVDALVLPTTPTAAPDRGAVRDEQAFVRTVSHTVPFNYTGHPALSVPFGTVDGRPAGCQFVAARDAESTVLSLGAVLEETGD